MSKVYIVINIDVENSINNLKLIDNELKKILHDDFRIKFLDSKGGNFKIGWFFKNYSSFSNKLEEFNYHEIRDFYIDNYGDLMDDFEDEHCFSHYDSNLNNEFSNIISKQIIERNWFPVAIRANNRKYSSDLSNRIDEFFPIDYSISPNINAADNLSDGINDWTVCKSDILNFSNCDYNQRLFARTLDFPDNEINNQIKKAFEVTQKGRNTILSIAIKDNLNITSQIDDFLKRVIKVSNNFADVKWEYATPTEAIINSIEYEQSPKSLFVEALIHNQKLRIWTSSEIFQNIPWIVLEDSNKNILHIEKNIIQDSTISWEVDISQYKNYRRIGIGVSSQNGLSDVTIINSNDEIFTSFLDKPLRRHPISYRGINEHSKLYPKLCIDRVLELAPEMDSIKQLCSILKEYSPKNKSLLDVGCASGQLFLSTNKLGIDYHGIDTFQRGIQIGKLILGQKGLPKSKLRNISINQISPKEQYDFVVNLFTFRYSEQFENHIEVMARATKDTMVIRAPSFGKKHIKRYLPDILLEKDFQTIKEFFNIYDEKEIENFLIKEGFKVSWIEDDRQKQKFNSKPELVGGIEFNYKFLVANRIKDKPSKKEILGDYWLHHAEKWTNEGEGLPN